MYLECDIKTSAKRSRPAWGVKPWGGGGGRGNMHKFLIPTVLYGKGDFHLKTCHESTEGE